MAPILTLGKDGWVLIGNANDTDADMGDSDKLDRIKHILDEYELKWEGNDKQSLIQIDLEDGVEKNIIEAFVNSQPQFGGIQSRTKEALKKKYVEEQSIEDEDDLSIEFDIKLNKTLGDLFVSDDNGVTYKVADLYRPLSYLSIQDRHELLNSIVDVLFDVKVDEYTQNMRIDCGDVLSNLKVLEDPIFSRARASVFGKNLYREWEDRIGGDESDSDSESDAETEESFNGPETNTIDDIDWSSSDDDADSDDSSNDPETDTRINLSDDAKAKVTVLSSGSEDSEESSDSESDDRLPNGRLALFNKSVLALINGIGDDVNSDDDEDDDFVIDICGSDNTTTVSKVEIWMKELLKLETDTTDLDIEDEDDENGNLRITDEDDNTSFDLKDVDEKSELYGLITALNKSVNKSGTLSDRLGSLGKTRAASYVTILLELKQITSDDIPSLFEWSSDREDGEWDSTIVDVQDLEELRDDSRKQTAGVLPNNLRYYIKELGNDGGVASDEFEAAKRFVCAYMDTIEGVVEGTTLAEDFKIKYKSYKRNYTGPKGKKWLPDYNKWLREETTKDGYVMEFLESLAGIYDGLRYHLYPESEEGFLERSQYIKNEEGKFVFKQGTQVYFYHAFEKLLYKMTGFENLYGVLVAHLVDDDEYIRYGDPDPGGGVYSAYHTYDRTKPDKFELEGKDGGVLEALPIWNASFAIHGFNSPSEYDDHLQKRKDEFEGLLNSEDEKVREDAKIYMSKSLPMLNRPELVEWAYKKENFKKFENTFIFPSENEIRRRPYPIFESTVESAFEILALFSEEADQGVSSGNEHEAIGNSGWTSELQVIASNFFSGTLTEVQDDRPLLPANLMRLFITTFRKHAKEIDNTIRTKVEDQLKRDAIGDRAQKVSVFGEDRVNGLERKIDQETPLRDYWPTDGDYKILHRAIGTIGFVSLEQFTKAILALANGDKSNTSIDWDLPDVRDYRSAKLSEGESKKFSILNDAQVLEIVSNSEKQEEGIYKWFQYSPDPQLYIETTLAAIKELYQIPEYVSGLFKNAEDTKVQLVAKAVNQNYDKYNGTDGSGYKNAWGPGLLKGKYLLQLNDDEDFTLNPEWTTRFKAEIDNLTKKSEKAHTEGDDITGDDEGYLQTSPFELFLEDEHNWENKNDYETLAVDPAFIKYFEQRHTEADLVRITPAFVRDFYGTQQKGQGTGSNSLAREDFTRLFERGQTGGKRQKTSPNQNPNPLEQFNRLFDRSETNLRKLGNKRSRDKMTAKIAALAARVKSKMFNAPAPIGCHECGGGEESGSECECDEDGRDTCNAKIGFDVDDNKFNEIESDDETDNDEMIHSYIGKSVAKTPLSEVTSMLSLVRI